VITGFKGLVLSIAKIVLFSEFLPLKSVVAIPISSPAFQSTCWNNVIFDSPAYTVESKSVHAGYLGTPCKSSVQYLHPITLFP
jgi:hypothetical protein